MAIWMKARYRKEMKAITLKKTFMGLISTFYNKEIVVSIGLNPFPSDFALVLRIIYCNIDRHGEMRM